MEAIASRIIELASAENMEAEIAAIESEGYQLDRSSGFVETSLFGERVAGIMDALVEGERAGVWIDRKPTLVRLDEVIEVPPQPLAEVRGKVRRQLLAVQVRDAVTKARQRVLDQATIQRSAEAASWYVK